jgi:CHASE3 domain sensor protein
MRSLYKPSGVVLAFGLLLSVLAVNAFIMRRQLSVRIGAEAWVTHTRQVLFETEQTESLLRQAESAQGGFLYTGDPIYLAPYSRAAAQVEPHIDNLSRLTADNPSQDAYRKSQRNTIASIYLASCLAAFGLVLL